MELIIVSGCTLIQSIYGVGLLVFGTPLLLLYGVDFLPALGLLLPSSILISVFQSLNSSDAADFEKMLLPYSFAGVVCGSCILLLLSGLLKINIIVGLTMFAAIAVRLHSNARKLLVLFFDRYRKTFHFFLAAFHGVSNLGGVFLSVYSSTVYDRKADIVFCTSIFYLLFASAQVGVITAYGNGEIFLPGLKFLPLTCIIYYVFGRRVYNWISQNIFDYLVNAFFLCVGVLFLFK